MRVVIATSPTPLDDSVVAHGPWQLAPAADAAASTPVLSFADVVTSETVLDEAVASADPKELVVVVTARHFAWFAAWASARGYAQDVLLNAGCTAGDASDEPSVEASIHAAVRHAKGPLGVDDAVLFPMQIVHLQGASSAGTTEVSSVENIPAAAGSMIRTSGAQEGARPTSSSADSVPEVAAWAAAYRAKFPDAHVGFSYARVGLMGNPSDQLHGKSMATTVDNFWARVVVRPSKCLLVRPHPIADQAAFASLADASSTVTRNGYSGGQRLILAALKRFRIMCVSELCDAGAIAKNFALEYDTNVPRQVGLAGSSCIVSAIFKALASFYGLTLDMDSAPSSVLAAEWEELGIHAGLMDRVSQMWGGLVAMDFDKDHVLTTGRGKYSRLDAASLPPLYLAYAMDPSDSGKIHSTVKERYFRGDEEVIAASRTFAGFVDEAAEALAAGDHKTFAACVDKNFDLRRQLYGDECLGCKNLDMVTIARQHTAAAKFPGSGGAILVVPTPAVTTESHIDAMRSALQSRGYVLIRLRVAA